MNLTMTNIKTLVRDCNATLTLQKSIFRLAMISLLDVGDGINSGDTICTLALTALDNTAYYNRCTIAIHEKSEVVDVVMSNSNDDARSNKLKVKLHRKVEVEQFTTLALTEYMLYGIPPKWIITQSISGWTNTKVVYNQNGMYACIHTTVIKQLMENKVVEVLNARFSTNKSIIVDNKNYKKTNFKCGPTSIWWR